MTDDTPRPEPGPRTPWHVYATIAIAAIGAGGMIGGTISRYSGADSARDGKIAALEQRVGAIEHDHDLVLTTSVDVRYLVDRAKREDAQTPEARRP